MSQHSYLDLDGLSKYHANVKTEIGKKVDAEAGKGLSTNDFTTSEKEKLDGLKNYTLPVADEETLGGVKIESTENPVPSKTALKTDATGVAFVDWAEAPKASASDPGLIKLGSSLKVNEDGSVDVDASHVGPHDVSWSNILDKPDLALKSDLTAVYRYKGSVTTTAGLPTEDVTIGDVYNVEATGMNYGWTGTEWDPLGEIFEITPISDGEINALFDGSDS